MLRETHLGLAPSLWIWLQVVILHMHKHTHTHIYTQVLPWEPLPALWKYNGCLSVSGVATHCNTHTYTKNDEECIVFYILMNKTTHFFIHKKNENISGLHSTTLWTLTSRRAGRPGTRFKLLCWILAIIYPRDLLLSWTLPLTSHGEDEHGCFTILNIPHVWNIILNV